VTAATKRGGERKRPQPSRYVSAHGTERPGPVRPCGGMAEPSIVAAPMIWRLRK
jgi:hypothetical protein